MVQRGVDRVRPLHLFINVLSGDSLSDGTMNSPLNLVTIV